jgi:DNA helicase-2/ATP-dependent DNA helicase PcrA
MWVGTFHGLAHKLLRMHHDCAQLPQNFQVLDDNDQERLIKQTLKRLELDDKVWKPKTIKAFINRNKECGVRAEAIEMQSNEIWHQRMRDIYLAYQHYCQQQGVVDFSELLLRSYEMWRDHPALLEQYQQRFRFVLVDEFQDTNHIQYAWLRLLARPENTFFVVGDDDQSIYSFRGAKVEHIQLFTQDFPHSRLIRLEQNYRSSGMILAAANGLIAHNYQRLGKKLWTQGAAGEPVYLYTAYHEREEAEFIVQKIQEWTESLQEVAILYRTSAQSRQFEEVFLQKGIPYRIYGGLRFYERAEVKDALAYLRLAYNHEDDGAFERIINTPKRGIGERSLEMIRSHARKHGLSLWQAMLQLATETAFSKKIATTLHDFSIYINDITQKSASLELNKIVQHICDTSGLLAHYEKEGKDEAQRRHENLEELVAAAKDYPTNDAEDGFDPVTAFLAHAVLEAADIQGDINQTCVQLMTLHLAKGLEFKLVFLCGLEEDLFPHKNSVEENMVEEERRLCYVGITRAKQRLYLSHCETRFRFGSRELSRPSRFIKEIPSELLQSVRLQHVSPSFHATLAKYPVGTWVRHPKFGRGVVLKTDGSGETARLEVYFPQLGNKWLVLAYAELQKE